MDQWIQYKLGKQYLLKENYATLGIKPRTYSYPGRSGNHYSVSWVKINLVAIRHYIQVR